MHREKALEILIFSSKIKALHELNKFFLKNLKKGG